MTAAQRTARYKERHPERVRVSHEHYRKTHQKEITEYGRSRYKDLRKGGICTRCGCRPACLGHIACIACAKVTCRHTKAYRQGLRDKIFERLGKRCRVCGIIDRRVLQMDHVNGGGEAQRRELRNGVLYLRYILTHLDEFQLLCANCNWIKRIENNE